MGGKIQAKNVADSIKSNSHLPRVRPSQKVAKPSTSGLPNLSTRLLTKTNFSSQVSSDRLLANRPSPKKPGFKWIHWAELAGGALVLGGGIALTATAKNRDLQRGFGVGTLTAGGSMVLFKGLETLFGGKPAPLWYKISVAVGIGVIAGIAYGLMGRFDGSGIQVKTNPGQRNPTDGYGP